jgi:hypothetical protein
MVFFCVNDVVFSCSFLSVYTILYVLPLSSTAMPKGHHLSSSERKDIFDIFSSLHKEYYKDKGALGKNLRSEPIVEQPNQMAFLRLVVKEVRLKHNRIPNLRRISVNTLKRLYREYLDSAHSGRETSSRDPHTQGRKKLMPTVGLEKLKSILRERQKRGVSTPRRDLRPLVL